jgi:hypothetical protein
LFDGDLPPAAICDRLDGNAAFATGALVENAQFRGCEGRLRADTPEGASPASSARRPIVPPSFIDDGGSPEDDSRISTVAVVVAVLASLFSIALFLYVLFRSRAQEARDASAQCSDAMMEAKSDCIEPVSEPHVEPVAAA